MKIREILKDFNDFSLLGLCVYVSLDYKNMAMCQGIISLGKKLYLKIQNSYNCLFA